MIETSSQNMQTDVQRAYKSIEDGKEGLNKGIRIKHDSIRKYIPDILQSTFYLTGAAPKAGKTAFVDDMFLVAALDHHIPEDVNITYFSFEISRYKKLMQLIRKYVFYNTGTIITEHELLSRGDFQLSKEKTLEVNKVRKEIEDKWSRVKLYDAAMSPNSMKRILDRRIKEIGELNNNQFHLVFIDHISLIMNNPGQSLKQSIDELSKYFIHIRNNHKCTIVVVQQLGFETESDNRFKDNRMKPQGRDFSDSKYVTRDFIITIWCLSNIVAYLLHEEDRDKQRRISTTI